MNYKIILLFCVIAMTCNVVNSSTFGGSFFVKDGLKTGSKDVEKTDGEYLSGEVEDIEAVSHQVRSLRLKTEALRDEVKRLTMLARLVKKK